MDYRHLHCQLRKNDETAQNSAKTGPKEEDKN